MTIQTPDGNYYEVTMTLVAPPIPTDAVVINMLQPPDAWVMNHDAATPGQSSGTTSYPVTAPDGTTGCRLFEFGGSGGGGEIYHTVALNNAAGYNSFCYETFELMPNIANVANFEKDDEITDPDGTVHDMATQIANGVVQITGSGHWITTGIQVPLRKPGVWMHSRRFTSYNGDGTVTYVGYEQDQVYFPIKQTLPQVGTTKWAPSILNVQLQYDTTGNDLKSDVYMSGFNIYAWKV
jgi:hypothetical protein